MSSGAGGLGLEKNVLTQNSSGTYFTSCESKFPHVIQKWEAAAFCFWTSFECCCVLTPPVMRKKSIDLDFVSHQLQFFKNFQFFAALS